MSRPACWKVALVPFYGDVRVGGGLEARWDEATIVSDEAAPEDRKRLIEALGLIGWLGAVIREVISVDTRRLMRLQHRIDRGESCEQLAAAEGLPVEVLREQLAHFRDEQRRAAEEIARRLR